MTWVLLVVLVVIVLFMAFNGRQPVPWIKQMRRIRAGVARKGEWMASDDVIEQVKTDYLAAVRFLHDHVLQARACRQAAQYLSGSYLKRHETIRANWRERQPVCLGVLRADHHLTVRHFSETGDTCLLVDQQTQRRMASYDAKTHTRITTQDLGDGVLVYRMVYDVAAGRWKIDEFIQELPTGWSKRRPSHRIRELSVMPPAIGRDH